MQLKKLKDVQTGKNSFQTILDTLYETYGVECPECAQRQVKTLLVRPRIRNRRTGKKMAGVCPVCYYKEPTKTNQISDRDARLALQAAKKSSMNYLLNFSIFPSGSVFNGKFSNFKTPNAETEKAKAKAMNAAKNIADDRPIHCLLFGDTGRGKTHLESAMIYEITKRSMYHAKIIFLDLAIMDQMHKMAINDKEADKRLASTILEVPKADLVILDDVGRESDNNWSKSFVDDVARYREEKPLVISTNLSGEGMKAFYSDQTLSRLKRNMRGYAISLKQTGDWREEH